MIRNVSLKDAAAITDIYNYYIVNTTVSFEEVPITAPETERRIQAIIPKFPYIVFEENGIIEGYAYLSTWKSRISYRYAAEVSIYLRSGSEGRGIGSMLMERLLNDSGTGPLHALVACIALPNPSSVALHEKFGFQKVGYFPEVGYKMDQWIDVGFWQLIP
jgi:phosphinothricin acetyltransferase